MLLLFLAACTLKGTTDPPLPVDAFDPVAALPAVTAFAGDAELLGFEARYIRTDGTLDLTADYFPGLTYTFVRPRTTHDAAPVGTGVRDRAYEKVDVRVRAPGWVQVTHMGGGGCDDPSGTFKHKGMEQGVSYVDIDDWYARTAAPECDVAAVWDRVREAHDVPDGAVATLAYSGAGYEFVLADLGIHTWFSASCEPLSGERFDELESDLRKSPEERAERARARAERAERDAEREQRRAEYEAKRLEAEARRTGKPAPAEAP